MTVRPPRAREQPHEWRILRPEEVGAVVRAYNELIGSAETDHERDDAQTSRMMFLTCVELGLRRGEILGLHWRNVSLADPTGPTLRVAETFTVNRIDTPKSRSSRRTLAVSARLADELFAHRGRTPFDGDDEYVFCNPRTGHTFDVAVHGRIFKQALVKAGIEERVRPFHDQRHTSLTNAAVAGGSMASVQARAGHSSPAMTAKYVNLAGQLFREESELAAARLWGEPEAVEIAG